MGVGLLVEGPFNDIPISEGGLTSTASPPEFPFSECQISSASVNNRRSLLHLQLTMHLNVRLYLPPVVLAG